MCIFLIFNTIVSCIKRHSVEHAISCKSVMKLGSNQQLIEEAFCQNKVHAIRLTIFYLIHAHFSTLQVYFKIDHCSNLIAIQYSKDVFFLTHILLTTSHKPHIFIVGFNFVKC